jgi:hypothetical protein
MPGSKLAKTAAVTALLLAAGGRRALTQPQLETRNLTPNGTRKLLEFERNYKNATNLAKHKAIRGELGREPWPSYDPESMKYVQSRASQKGARMERSFTNSVAAQWSSNGVMPQDMFDAVIEQQVPTLGEWDVFAHGQIEGEKNGRVREFVVPPNTAIVFWNVPGTPTVVAKSKQVTGISPIPNRKVTAKAKTGNATARPDAYSVMHIGGDRIPDVVFDFHDDSIPMGVFKSATGKVDPQKVHAARLSQFVKVNGPGVYYVLSCRSVLEKNQNSISYEALQNSIQRNQRARERQRKYSNPKAFDGFRGRNLLHTVSPSNINQANFVGEKLSGWDVPERIMAMCLSLFLPYIIKKGTAFIVKGAYINEMNLLIDIASGVGSISKKIVMYAGKRALEALSVIRKPDAMNQRTRRATMLRKLRTNARNGNAIAQSKLPPITLLRKYGFNTTNRLQLERLRAVHFKRLAQNVNRSAIAEMEAAYAFARKRREHESIVRSITRALFHRNRADARKAKIEPGMSKKATKLMRAWGFKDGMTKNAVNREYARQKSQYSLLNRWRGRVPQDLAMAYQIATRRAK